MEACPYTSKTLWRRRCKVHQQHQQRSEANAAGDSIVRTPSLDRLAEQGVRLENHHCANPLCVLSRMTFLTSRHSSDIGVWTNQCRLESTIPTFVHYLDNADYETVLCGRMYFTGPDQRHGFERRILGDVHVKLEHVPICTTGQSADGVKIAGPGPYSLRPGGYPCMSAVSGNTR